MLDPFKTAPLLWSIFAISVLAVALGLAGVDGIIARNLHPNLDPLAGLVGVLDVVALKPVSNFLLGAVLVVGSALAILAPSFRANARLVLYIGLVQFASTTVLDLSKPVFGRLRPFEMIEGGTADLWFTGANSFPSGHAGFYAGLVFPIVALWPKFWPLLIVPALVATQRVLSLDHYLSDVSASIAVAALLTLLLKPVAGLRALPAGAASARSR